MRDTIVALTFRDLTHDAAMTSKTPITILAPLLSSFLFIACGDTTEDQTGESATIEESSTYETRSSELVLRRSAREMLLEKKISALEERIAILEAKTAPLRMSAGTLYVEDVNLHIAARALGRSGSGNLILGEVSAGHDIDHARHNLILGGLHRVRGEGNLVSGVGHDVNADDVLLVGSEHVARATGGSITGGFRNHLLDEGAHIGAGSYNEARGIHSAILAGDGNITSATSSVVITGNENHAFAENAVVLGGRKNAAGGAHSVVVSGSENILLGQDSLLCGGTSVTLLADDEILCGP